MMTQQSKPITATASMWASAATHLEHRIEYIRIDGERIAVVTSGNSDRVYRLPADASSCPCIWNTQTQTMCSHMLALELSVTMEHLAETPHTFADYRARYPGCAGGCGQIVEARDGLWCDDCAAARERAQRLAAGRAKVLAEMAS